MAATRSINGLPPVLAKEGLVALPKKGGRKGGRNDSRKGGSR